MTGPLPRMRLLTGRSRRRRQQRAATARRQCRPCGARPGEALHRMWRGRRSPGSDLHHPALLSGVPTARKAAALCIRSRRPLAHPRLRRGCLADMAVDLDLLEDMGATGLFRGLRLPLRDALSRWGTVRLWGGSGALRALACGIQGQQQHCLGISLSPPHGLPTKEVHCIQRARTHTPVLPNAGWLCAIPALLRPRCRCVGTRVGP